MKTLLNVTIAALVITLGAPLSALHAQPVASTSTSSASIAVGAVVADCAAVAASGGTTLTSADTRCEQHYAATPELQRCLSADDYRCATSVGTDRSRPENLGMIEQLYF